MSINYIDVSSVFPNEYSSEAITFGEVTGTRGSPRTCTSLNLGRQLSTTEVEVLAKFFLTASLNSRNLVSNDVIFTPADTIEHTNTQGKPCYVMEILSETGEYEYEFETHFKLK